MLTAYIFILLALLASAFFSGSEIAFISANRLKLEVKTQKGELPAKILSNFYERPSAFLGTMLVGNNIALVIFGILTEAVWKESLQEVLPAWLAGDFAVLLMLTFITTIIVLIGGEFVPKSLFQMFAERLLLFFAIPLRIIYWLLFPVVWLTVKISEFLLKTILKTEITEEAYTFSRVDLEDFVTEFSESVEENEQEVDSDLLQQALQLRTITVSDCLIPTAEVECVSVDIELETLKQKFIESRFSRLLVKDASGNSFKGYIHHQYMFKDFQNIEDIILDISSVDIDDDGYEVLNEFIQNKKSIAYVVNANKATVGIITLEDILERIFGEIEDEHDD